MMKKFPFVPLAALAFAAACSDTNQNPLAAPGEPLFHGGDSWKLTTPVANRVTTASTAAPWNLTIYWTASTSPNPSHDDVGAYQFILRQRTPGGWTTLVRINDHDAATTWRQVNLTSDGTYLVQLRGLAAQSNSHNSRRSSACFILGTSSLSCPTDTSELPGDGGDSGDDDDPIIIDPTDPTEPSSQTITFGALGGKSYGDDPFLVTASASSNLTVTFSSLTEDECTVTTSGYVTILQVGTCTIKASQNGGFVGETEYLAAEPVNRSFQIAPRAIEVTADGKSKVYGDSDPALTYRITSGSLVDGDSFSGALSRAAGETVAGSPFAIQKGTLELSSNYDLTFVGANLTITRAALTVTADDKTMERNQALPVLTGTITGQKFSDSFTASYTTTADGRTFGEFPIVASNATGAAIGNYDVNYVNGTLRVVAAAIQACTPGFWQGGTGSQWWNVSRDADWKGALAQPYFHGTEFNRFFTSHAALNGQTMLQVVGNGATSVPAQKAARSLVAAYLNTSQKAGYGYTQRQLTDMWTAAARMKDVSAQNAEFERIHQDLDARNNAFDCR